MIGKGCPVTETFNKGSVIGNKYIGGIVGKVECLSEKIEIKYNYNKGFIYAIEVNDKGNGGIVGGTSESASDINKFIIAECFSIGTNNSVLANQISPQYATVSDAYYLTATTNKSGYGTASALKNFTWSSGSNSTSIFVKLRDKSNVWSLDPKWDIKLAWEN